MANDNFEKRMEFLKKSYERVPASFDPDEVLRKIDQEKIPQPKEQKPPKGGIRQTFTIWAMGIASILIIGIIGAAILSDQKENAEVNTMESAELDAFIEDLNAKFEVEKEKRREMLKMDEEHFEQYVVSSSRWLLSMESFTDNIKQYENAKEILSNHYELAIEELKLPAEMVQDLKRNPLTEDEAGSIEFVTMYREKVNRLISIYNQIIDENREAIEEFEVSPSVDKAEIMMLTSKSFPEQLQNIINTMKEQSIRLETGKYTGEIEARYYASLMDEAFGNNLHTYTFGYRRMLTDGPYMYGGILQHPPLLSSAMIQDMEYTLINVEQDSTLYPILKTYYNTLFIEIMKGGNSTKIFDAEGVLLSEYQEAWRNMTGGGQATPIRYLVEPIIKEMEASGWKASASWEKLDYDDLDEALFLYREGKLEEYMYGERPDFQDAAIQFPNTSFDKEVQAYYENFKKSHDKSVLKGASPIHVVAVFDYANELDDPETMYHLFNENILNHNESGIDYTLDYYVNNWRKGLPFLRNAAEVKFYKDKVYRHDLSFYTTLEFTGVDRAITMVYSEEGVWELGTLWMDRLPMYHMSPEMDFQHDIMGMSDYYYEGLISTDNVDSYLRWSQPLDVLGMYFYAGSKGFYETQYELFYQGEGAELVDIETYLENPGQYFLPYDDKMYKKASFHGLEQDKNGIWPGIATLTVDKELYPDLPSERKFHMIWTEDGWRVKFNPFEQ